MNKRWGVGRGSNWMMEKSLTKGLVMKVGAGFRKLHSPSPHPPSTSGKSISLPEEGCGAVRAILQSCGLG